MNNVEMTWGMLAKEIDIALKEAGASGLSYMEQDGLCKNADMFFPIIIARAEESGAIDQETRDRIADLMAAAGEYCEEDFNGNFWFWFGYMSYERL